MNLKEAFRYQNKLQALLVQAQSILRSDENITRTETTYMRHKVMPEVQDETVVKEPETEYYHQITEVVRFLVYVMAEKEKLSAAIRHAKSKLDIDMDNEVSLNALRQSLPGTFKRMCDLRGSEKVIPNGGSGYRFNSDGNQTTYTCDVKRVTTINFDRNVVRKELQKLSKQADEISAKIDLCMVTTDVAYVPPFDVNDTFATTFEQYVQEVGK